jgi:hypothetical protein
MTLTDLTTQGLEKSDERSGRRHVGDGERRAQECEGMKTVSSQQKMKEMSTHFFDSSASTPPLLVAAQVPGSICPPLPLTVLP